MMDIWTNWLVASLVHHFSTQKTYNSFHPYIMSKKQSLTKINKNYEKNKAAVCKNLTQNITPEINQNEDDKYTCQSYLFTQGTVTKKKKWWVVTNNHLYKYNSYTNFQLQKNFDLKLFSIKKVNFLFFIFLLFFIFIFIFIFIIYFYFYFLFYFLFCFLFYFLFCFF